MPTTPAVPQPLNVAVLCGTLSSDPVARTLPSGDVLHALEITVRVLDQPADTVPVVTATLPSGVAAGSEVLVVGRVRRRFFRAGSSTASRTEVVAERVVPTGRRAAARRVVEGIAQRLVEAG
ncbi:hypothetical protein [Actinomarinicola tropica]|uniref:Single-stranded DNA-binding protein n=1 Tax=Actinomarinicola tropica TaxID=2789776 RepID=A0A5Q2RLA8_9ACTN|nr:hypothetical protein [Actinomarinicola tropica]QGG95216.1 hypothetical protein GH723_08985 [Actinomarinicola tropica]